MEPITNSRETDSWIIIVEADTELQTDLDKQTNTFNNCARAVLQGCSDAP